MTGRPLLPVFIGNFPAPFHLAGQHHGDPDQIGRIIEINGLQIFIDEFYFHLSGQGGGEDNRAVGGKMELGLPLKLFPFRINQFKFHKKKIS